MLQTGKIAPESSGSYNFYIRNKNNFEIKYQISLSEFNTSNINMKYRIKINGVYISEEWSSIEELERTYRSLKIESQVLYTIEWKWEQSENDTQAGIDADIYKVVLDIYATEA